MNPLTDSRQICEGDNLRFILLSGQSVRYNAYVLAHRGGAIMHGAYYGKQPKRKI